MASVQFVILLAIATFVPYHVSGAVCGAELASCLGPDLMSLATGNMQDMTPAMMPKVCSAMQCFGDLQCELPAELNAALEPMGSMCGSGSGGECSMMSLVACFGDKEMPKFSSEQPTKEELKQLCPAKSCLAELQPKCTGEVKEIVDNFVSMLQMSCQEGCDPSKFQSCMTDISDRSNMDDLDEEYCKVLKDAAACLKPHVQKCKDFPIPAMNEMINNLTSFNECCPKMVSVKNKCVMENKIQDLIKVQNMEECKKTESVYSCVMTSDLKCSGPMANDANEVKQIMKSALNKCETSGYNITISLESGKSLDDNAGFALHPSVTIVFGLMVAGVAGLWF